MSNYGIIVINWMDKTKAGKIQEIINSLYNDNTSAITGMAYYETEDKSLVKDIETLCISPMKKDDAAIKNDLRISR